MTPVSTNPLDYPFPLQRERVIHICKIGAEHNQQCRFLSVDKLDGSISAAG